MDWSQLALMGLVTGIVLLVLGAICILLITLIQRALTVKNRREHVIQLTNQGNFVSIFMLSASSVERMLSFKLLLNDIPLVAVPQAEPPMPAAQGSSLVVADSAALPKSAKKTNANMSGAVKSGQAVAAKVGLVATVLGTLGSLLPGNLGSGLRAQSQALREAQSNTLSAVQAPVNAQRRAEALQQESSKLVGAKPAASDSSPKAVQAGMMSDSDVAQPKIASLPSSVAAKRAPAGVYVVQTRPVDPGAALFLVLRIESLKRCQSEGSFAYTLSSQQVPVEAIGEDQPPVLRQAVVHFPPVELWRYWLAPLMNLAVVASVLFVLILILRWIWF